MAFGVGSYKPPPQLDFSLLESPKTANFRSFEAFFILLRVVFEGRHAIKTRQPASMAQFRRFGFPKRLKSNSGGGSLQDVRQARSASEVFRGFAGRET